MAITKSGLFAGTFSRGLTGVSVIDLGLETGMGYLVSDTAAPVYSAATSCYSDYSATEISGGSWVLSGIALTGTTTDLTTTAETLIFDAADVSVGTTTLASAMGYIYRIAASPYENVFLVDFVTAVSTSNGTFEIVWAAPGSGGIFNIDCA
jgi:hypothetical protein